MSISSDVRSELDAQNHERSNRIRNQDLNVSISNGIRSELDTLPHEKVLLFDLKSRPETNVCHQRH